MSFVSNFSDKGYNLEKNVFSAETTTKLEIEFDNIVSQLIESGESINARWGSDLTKDIEATDSEVIHTHNVKVIPLACYLWSRRKNYWILLSC